MGAGGVIAVVGNGSGVREGIGVGSIVGVAVERSRKGKGSSVAVPSSGGDGVAERKMICGSLVGEGVAEAQAARSVAKNTRQSFTRIL